jgi:hypothetical protein
MLVALPAVCAAPEGILHSSPGMTVDGTAAMDGMHIFGGQMLRTPHGQFGDLLTRGSSLRMFSDTRLEFEGDSAELVQGAVALKTSTRFRLRTGCAEVTPLGPGMARYTVQLQDKTVYVTADEQDVSVRAKKNVRVPTHKTVAVYCAAAAQNIVFVGSDLGPKVAMGASSAGAGALAALPDLSASGPE